MLDFIKLRINNQELINRVFLHPDFVKCKPKNNYYYSKFQKEINTKLQLDFLKSQLSTVPSDFFTPIYIPFSSFIK